LVIPLSALEIARIVQDAEVMDETTLQRAEGVPHGTGFRIPMECWLETTWVKSREMVERELMRRRGERERGREIWCCCGCWVSRRRRLKEITSEEMSTLGVALLDWQKQLTHKKFLREMSQVPLRLRRGGGQGQGLRDWGRWRGRGEQEIHPNHLVKDCIGEFPTNDESRVTLWDLVSWQQEEEEKRQEWWVKARNELRAVSPISPEWRYAISERA
jgi:hypothetical protein